MSTDKMQQASSGVEQLIERLRREAVEAGRRKAEEVVVDAQKRAEWLIEEAEKEADNIVKAAREEADSIRAAGLDALKLASRDSLLRLRDTLLGSFSQEVMRVVGDAMAKQPLIEQLILTVAGRVRDKAGLDQCDSLHVILPEDVVGIEELRANPEALHGTELSKLSAAIAADLLREGVTFDVSDDFNSGIMIKLEDNAMQIDLTDKTVAALLLEHLQPRFRALLQGIVK